MSHRFRINENFQIRQLRHLPGQIEFCLPSWLSLSSNRFATARSRQMIRIVFRTIRGEEGKGSLVRGIYRSNELSGSTLGYFFFVSCGSPLG